MLLALAACTAWATPVATGESDFFVAPAPGQEIPPPPGADARDAAAVADAWARRNRARTGLARQGADLEVTEVERARGGVRVVRMQQEVRGIPVLGAQTVVSVQGDGDIAAVTGERLGGPTPDLAPRITPSRARDIAVADAAARYGVSPAALRATTPTRVIFEPGLFGAPSPERSFLGWRLQVTAHDADVHDMVIVHADQGYSTFIPLQAHARERLVCDGGNVRGRDVPCTAGVAERTEGAAATGDTQVDNAYTYLGGVITYFNTVFGRNSYDGLGTAVPATVRGCYATDATCPLVNAGWRTNHMVLGDGWATDDMVAHEFVHGVTQTTANLYYWYQSGAINESMSDVFGEFSDLTDGVGGDLTANRWRFGEDLATGYIRSLSNPTIFGHPDRTGSASYRTTEDDNGGVHRNSGVGNKAASLITDGGTFNGRSVTGIGQVKAQQIYYRALSTLLRSGSDYQDLRVALGSACQALIGSYGITAANCTQVDNATLATEMHLVPALAPGAQATVCSALQEPTYQNGVRDDIETWTGGITAVSATGTVNDYMFRPDWYAAGGTRSLRLSALAQALDGAWEWHNLTGIVVPTNAYLSFDHAYWLEEGVDGVVVEYSVRTNGVWGGWNDAMGLVNSGYLPSSISAGSGTALAGRQAFTGISRGWGSSRLNLSSLAGRTVKFRFRMVTNATTAGQGWFLDNLAVYQCGGGDTVQPITSLTSSPAASIRSTSATFAFTSNEAGSTFQCAMDAGAFTACTSPITYRNLAQGSHQFLVRATDLAGNYDWTPEVSAFTVDTTPPDTTLLSGPPAAQSATSATITFSSPDGSATFQCARGSEAYAPCTSPRTWTGLTDGTHILRVQAVDAAGNVDSTPPSATVRVDTVAPTATFTSVPGAYLRATSASLAMTSNEVATGATFQCRLDAAASFTACTSPVSLTGLSQGTHTLAVRAVDAAGNVGVAASTSFTVDTVPPDTTIATGPGPWINVTSATVPFSATEAGSTVQCQLDDAAYGTCTSPSAFTDLDEGAHIVRVRATDPAGNTDSSPASRTFRVDLTNPDTRLLSAPEPVINSTSASIAFEPVDPADTQADCRRDAGAWGACTSPFTVTGLSDGTHTLGARARDSATNVDLDPVWVTFVVDRIEPTTTITSGPSGAVSSPDATFGFASAEAGVTFECALDADPYTGCDAPFVVPDIVDGTHQFYVRATDAAGNTDSTPASRSFTVDTTEPTTTITAEPEPSILGAAADVEMTADEPVARFECALDGAAFATCSSPHSFTGMALGDHELRVRAVDLVGNVESSPQVVYVTREAPQPPEPEPPADDPGAGDETPGPDDPSDPSPVVDPPSRPGGQQQTASPWPVTAPAQATGLQAELARAQAALAAALSRCARGPVAQRRRCAARARAAHAYAVARARAGAARSAARARCAAGPAPARPACTRRADAAYARAMAQAARARATALRRAGR